jgi:hypothetical protein
MSVGMNYEAAGLSPGILAQADTVEAALYWGGDEKQVRKMGGLVSGSAVDAGNTPTDILRPGMLLGRITATKKLIQWDPTAVDGSENIYGIMGHDLKVNLNGTGTDRFYGPILVGGPIKASAIFRSNATYGKPGGFLTDPYENVARLQMRGRFWFDDEVGTVPFTGWPRVKSLKDVATANAYVMTNADNGTLFTNTGCGASQAVTLPNQALDPTAVGSSGQNALGFRCAFFMVEAQDIVLTVSAATIVVTGQSANYAGPLTITGAVGQYIEIQGVFDKTNAKWLVSLKTTSSTMYGGNAGANEAVTAAGTTRDDAAAIAATKTVATITCDSVAKGIVLPTAVFVNQRITLIGGAFSAHVYALSSGTIHGLAGAAIAGATGAILPAKAKVDIVCKDITTNTQLWVMVPGVIPQVVSAGALTGSTTVTQSAALAGTGTTAAACNIPASTTLARVIPTAAASIALPVPLYLGQRITVACEANYALSVFSADASLIKGGARHDQGCDDPRLLLGHLRSDQFGDR